MKKMKVLLVGILTLVMSLFCLVGCFEEGKYEAVAYKAGPLTVDIKADEDNSFIELKGDKTATVSINIIIGKIEGEGTWKNGEEEKQVIITINGVDYKATVDGDQLIIDVFGTQVIFEK